MTPFWLGLIGGIVGSLALTPIVVLVTRFWLVESLDRARREMFGPRGTRADALELL